MNYTEKQYEEIFESMLADSLSKGLISHAEEFQDYIKNNQDISNYYVMDKAVTAQMLAKVYKDITKAYESAKVEYAEGSDLDDIGKGIGIPRPPATYAEVELEFSLSAGLEEDVNVPKGVRVSTKEGIVYSTLEKIFIAEGDTKATVQAIAVQPGVGSKIISNAINKIVDDIGYELQVTNPTNSSGGTEAYTDDQYRYLLMNWTKIHVKGSSEAYENYFANFEGIDSYKIVPNWNGTGTIKCILDPGTPYQLNKAYQELQTLVVQATEDITMFAPSSKLIDIYAVVNVDIDRVNPYSTVEKSEIQARIITAIKVFIDGGYRANGEYYPGLILGEDFIPHKLAVFLDDEIPELKNIDFNYPKNYIEILDEEIGVSNEITIEMI
ncbi:MAG: baseplate J/gp47 family protein [Methanobrevibacter sp.]|nr:baseplate J/gp47 family protein [Methanobrevibacter sp.]